LGQISIVETVEVLIDGVRVRVQRTGERRPTSGYGSGGSGTSIGFYEALDVTQAFAYAQHLPRPGPELLYGTSMGAAAVVKAVADDDLGRLDLARKSESKGLHAPRFDELDKVVEKLKRKEKVDGRKKRD
jgi:hypothetical protein